MLIPENKERPHPDLQKLVQQIRDRQAYEQTVAAAETAQAKGDFDEAIKQYRLAQKMKGHEQYKGARA